MVDFPAKSKEKIDATLCATTGEDLKVFSNPQQPLDTRETGDEQFIERRSRKGWGSFSLNHIALILP